MLGLLLAYPLTYSHNQINCEEFLKASFGMLTRKFDGRNVKAFPDKQMKIVGRPKETLLKDMDSDANLR